MVTIKQISIHGIRSLIKFSYEGDTELLDKYHPFPGTLQHCVEMEMEQIEKLKQKHNLEYYITLYNEKPIGYLVKASDFLYSFALRKEFRTKDILIEWWTLIKNSFDKDWIIWIYNTNTRAVKFLERQGMNIIYTDEKIKLIILK